MPTCCAALEFEHSIFRGGPVGFIVRYLTLGVPKAAHYVFSELTSQLSLASRLSELLLQTKIILSSWFTSKSGVLIWKHPLTSDTIFQQGPYIILNITFKIYLVFFFIIVKSCTPHNCPWLFLMQLKNWCSNSYNWQWTLQTHEIAFWVSHFENFSFIKYFAPT